MSEEQLAFPLILGLDFLTQTGVQLNVAEGRYELTIKDHLKIFPFLQQPTWGQTVIQKKEHVTSLYMAMPLEETAQPELFVPSSKMKDIIMSHSAEVQSLLQAWPTVCSDHLGRTDRIIHQITTTDDIPIQSKAYRVSPLLRKEIMGREIEKMVQNGIIEPSQSPRASPVVLVPKPDDEDFVLIIAD